jgi:predicted TIM-barrel fold metal-dependent hydrolase
MKIFDSLSHIKSDASWYGTEHDSSIEKLLKEFDKGLSKTLLVGMPDDEIEYLITIANQHKDKFIPIAPVIFDDDTSHEKLEKQILHYKNTGFKGIKIHPRFLNTNLTDENIKTTINIAGKYDLVSLLCTVHRAPSKPLKRPLHDVIHEICDETHDSKIILLHGGYYDLLATSEVIRSFENTLLDLSATLIRFQDTHILNDIVYLFKTFDRRICIGSDFPEFTIEDVLNIIKNKILNNNLIDKEKLENIYFNNLNKFMEVHSHH